MQAIGAVVNERVGSGFNVSALPSGVLVAFGLIGSSPYRPLFVAAVLPVLFLVAVLTTLRLV